MWQFYDKNGALKQSAIITSQQLGYQTFVAAKSITSTSAAAADTIVTAPSIQSDGITPISIEFFSPAVSVPPTVGNYVNISLWEDGTDLGVITQVLSPAAAALNVPVRVTLLRTPSAGAHVYSVRAWVASGTGTVYGGAGTPGALIAGFVRVLRADWAVYIPGAVPRITTSPLSGGPPANPQDNDIWVATGVDASDTRWQFSYNAGSASAYKWDYIGGPPMYAEDAAGGETNSASYVDVGSNPSLTVARAGDYIIEFAAELGVNAHNIGTVAVYSTREAVKIGAAAALDSDSFLVQLYGGGSEFRATGAKLLRRTLAAADVVKLQTKVAATASYSSTSRRSLLIRPVRIS